MQSLVRAVIDGQEVNVSAAYAETHDLEVLDEPTHRDDGRRRAPTRLGGRPVKPKTSVAEAAAKKAAAKSAEPAESDTPPSKEK